MNRKFISNILFLVAINLLIKPFWFFGIEVTVQNRLANADYGLYFSLLSFSVLFNILLDLGITNFNNREIARYNNLVSKYFSNISIVKFLLGIVYLIISIVAGFIINYSYTHFILLLLLCFNQFLLSVILYLRSNVNGLLLFVTDSILSVLDKGLMIILCSILLWVNISGIQFNIWWFVGAQTLAFIITAIVALIIVLKKVAYFKPRFSMAYTIYVLKKSLPFSVLALLMSLYNRLEPVFLERMLTNGAEQAGLYAQAFRLLDVMANYALLFPVLLLPLFSRMLKNKLDISQLAHTSAMLLMVPMGVVAILASIFGSEIMLLLYHKPNSALIFSILINGIIGISATYIFGTLLTANGNLKELNIMAVIAVIVNVCLNLILVPKFKAHGSAIASVVTQIVTAIVQLILAYKILKMQIKWAIWIKYLILLACVVPIGIVAKQLISYIWFAFAVSIFISLLLAVIIKLLNFNELFIMLKSNKNEDINNNRSL